LREARAVSATSPRVSPSICVHGYLAQRDLRRPADATRSSRHLHLRLRNLWKSLAVWDLLEIAHPPTAIAPRIRVPTHQALDAPHQSASSLDALSVSVSATSPRVSPSICSGPILKLPVFLRLTLSLHGSGRDTGQDTRRAVDSRLESNKKEERHPVDEHQRLRVYFHLLGGCGS